jgi:hypothetical protein
MQPSRSEITAIEAFSRRIPNPILQKREISIFAHIKWEVGDPGDDRVSSSGSSEFVNIIMRQGRLAALNTCSFASVDIDVAGSGVEGSSLGGPVAMIVNNKFMIVKTKFMVCMPPAPTQPSMSPFGSLYAS